MFRTVNTIRSEEFGIKSIRIHQSGEQHARQHHVGVQRPSLGTLARGHRLRGSSPMQERRLRNIQLRLSRLSQSEWIAIPRPARPVHAAHERWTLQLAVTAEIRQPRVMPGHRHRRQRACMPHQQQRTGRRMIDGSAMIGIADSPLESIRIFAQIVDQTSQQSVVKIPEALGKPSGEATGHGQVLRAGLIPVIAGSRIVRRTHYRHLVNRSVSQRHRRSASIPRNKKWSRR